MQCYSDSEVTVDPNSKDLAMKVFYFVRSLVLIDLRSLYFRGQDSEIFASFHLLDFREVNMQNNPRIQRPLWSR